jgi:hypothetical protein
MRKTILGFLAASVLAVPAAHAGGEPAEAKRDLTETTCDDLARETEMNRAFALMFYYGYLAGRSNVAVIDGSRVADQLMQVREYCTDQPEATVIEAFTAALKE